MTLLQADKVFTACQQTALQPGHPGKATEVQNCERDLQNAIGFCGELQREDRVILGRHALAYINDLAGLQAPGGRIKSLYELMRDLNIHEK